MASLWTWTMQPRIADWCCAGVVAKAPLPGTPVLGDAPAVRDWENDRKCPKLVFTDSQSNGDTDNVSTESISLSEATFSPQSSSDEDGLPSEEYDADETHKGGDWDVVEPISRRETKWLKSRTTSGMIALNFEVMQRQSRR